MKLSANLIAVCFFSLLITSVSHGFEPTKLEWNGKFRFRYENTDWDQYDTRTSYFRDRQRMILELGMKANLTEEVMFGAMIGTGDDLKTLEIDAKNSKPFTLGLRRAYVGYSPQAIAGLTLNAGAMPMPFTQVAGSDLIFEYASPQGAAVIYEMTYGDLKIRPVIGEFILIENKTGDDSQILPGAQLDIKYSASDITYQAGVSNYFMKGIAGTSTANFSSGAFGNSSSGGSYVNNYNLLNAYASLTVPLGTVKTQLYYDSSQNLATTDANKAYLVGLKLSEGNWDVSYNYRDVQKDAVFGALSWGDPESTGVRTNYFHIGYKLTSNMDLRAAYLVHRSIDGYGTNDDHNVYKKMKLDLRMSF